MTKGKPEEPSEEKNAKSKRRRRGDDGTTTLKVKQGTVDDGTPPPSRGDHPKHPRIRLFHTALAKLELRPACELAETRRLEPPEYLYGQ